MIIYANKRWLKVLLPIRKLVRKLGYTLIGKINKDNYILKRRGTTNRIFHVLHISWGHEEAIEKYKLFRINIFD